MHENSPPKQRSIGLYIVLAGVAAYFLGVIVGGIHSPIEPLLLGSLALFPIGGIFCLFEIIVKRQWRNWGAWAGFAIALWAFGPFIVMKAMGY